MTSPLLLLLALAGNVIDQIVAIAGACLVLVAFALQRFQRISADGVIYLLLNFTGGVLLCWAAVSSGQIGFILLEGAWAFISLVGLWGWWMKRRKGALIK